MSATAILAVVVFVAAYVAIATEKVNRTVAALAGAALMVVIGAVRGHQMFFSEGTGIDWNVIFLLFGMMILVGILSHTGVFEFLAIWSAQLARGRPFRMMVTLSMITAVASALLDNVTTVLLIAPVTLLLCDRLALDPVPFLLSEVMASNIGGTATLIGDPPNIIIASRAGLSFNDFLIHLAPIVVVLLVVFIGLSWLLWGRQLRFDEQRAAALMALTPRETIADARLLRRTLVVLALVLTGFVTHSLTHIEPSVIALLGAGAAILISAAWFTRESSANSRAAWRAASMATGCWPHRRSSWGPPCCPESWTTSRMSRPCRRWSWISLAQRRGCRRRSWPRADHSEAACYWTFTKYGLIVTAVTIAICVPYIWLRYYPT